MKKLTVFKHKLIRRYNNKRLWEYSKHKCYDDGDGSGYGDGYDDGDGSGLLTYNGQKIYIIDSTPTLIDSAHGQYAKGNIVNSDLTLTPCYIARCGDSFAHGSTLEEARRDAECKALENEPIEQRIERFKATYPIVDAEASNSELYKWHNVLTGSCEFGRKAFAKEHDIDIENVPECRFAGPVPTDVEEFNNNTAQPVPNGADPDDPLGAKQGNLFR